MLKCLGFGLTIYGLGLRLGLEGPDLGLEILPLTTSLHFKLYFISQQQNVMYEK